MNVWNGGMIVTGENQSTQKKACSRATVHHKLHVDWPGFKPRFLQ